MMWKPGKTFFILLAAVLVVAGVVVFFPARLTVGRRGLGRASDFSGVYSMQLLKGRFTTTSVSHPFLPDTPAWSNALVVISQSGSTNITCVCLSASGEAVTNTIAVDGKTWWWKNGILAYSSSRAGPGLGFGAIPGFVKVKSGCEVLPDPIPIRAGGPSTLHVTFWCRISGWMFPFGRWHDPEEESKILLIPKKD